MSLHQIKFINFKCIIWYADIGTTDYFKNLTKTFISHIQEYFHTILSVYSQLKLIHKHKFYNSYFESFRLDWWLTIWNSDFTNLLYLYVYIF